MAAVAVRWPYQLALSCALGLTLGAVVACAPPVAQPAAPAPPAAKTQEQDAKGAAPAPAQPPAAQKRYKLKAAWNPASASAPVFIAREKKFYEELGLDIEFVRFNAGPPMFAAIQSGDIQAAVEISTIAYVVGRAQGLKAKIFGLTYDISPTNVLVVRRELNVKSAQDLKSKKIGAVTGSSGFYGLTTYLAKNGMTLNDIQYLNMEAATILPAFTRRDIDGAWIWTPWYNKMLEAGGVAVTDNLKEGALAVDLWIGRPEWLQSESEAAQRILEAQRRALGLLKAERQLVLSVMAQNMGIAEQVAGEVFERTPYPTLEEWAAKDSKYSLIAGVDNGTAGVAKILKDTSDFLTKNKLVQTTPDLKDTIEPGPLKAVMKLQ